MRIHFPFSQPFIVSFSPGLVSTPLERSGVVTGFIDNPVQPLMFLGPRQLFGAFPSSKIELIALPE